MFSTEAGLIRRRARRQVQKALSSGRIVKQRCVCGASEVVAHHPEYACPQKVLWLCESCHVALHAVLKQRKLDLVRSVDTKDHGGRKALWK